MKIAREGYPDPTAFDPEDKHYDPKSDPDAELLSEVSFLEVLSNELAVMDSAAIAVCKDNNTPIVVFDLLATGNFRSIVEGAAIGTLVK